MKHIVVPRWMGVFLALPENIVSQQKQPRINRLTYFTHHVIKKIKKNDHKTVWVTGSHLIYKYYVMVYCNYIKSSILQQKCFIYQGPMIQWLIKVIYFLLKTFIFSIKFIMQFWKQHYNDFFKTGKQIILSICGVVIIFFY